MSTKLMSGNPLPTILFTLCLFSSACTSAQVETQLKNIWISEAPPMAKVNAGYFDIENLSSDAVSLKQVSSTEFGRIEMHLSLVENNVAKMVKQESVEIPAGGKLSFEPGGYHLMLFDAKEAYKAGDEVTLIFYFSDESVIETAAEIRPLGGESRQMDHSHH